MKICEGDPLEIFLENGAVIFQKYFPNYRDDLMTTLQKATDYYENCEDNQVIAEQLRKIAKEINTLLA